MLLADNKSNKYIVQGVSENILFEQGLSLYSSSSSGLYL